MYHNDFKYSDRQVWANSVDLEQTAPEVAPEVAVWSGSKPFAILSTAFGCLSVW